MVTLSMVFEEGFAHSCLKMAKNGPETFLHAKNVFYRRDAGEI